MTFALDDELQTGIEAIDEQHAKLIDIYNELETKSKQGKAHRHMAEILARLHEYAQFHFEFEETEMREAEFSGYEQHRAEHQQLLRKLKDFVARYCGRQERITADMLKFVRTWVTHHIHDCDMQYVDCLKAHAGESEDTEPSAEADAPEPAPTEA